MDIASSLALECARGCGRRRWRPEEARGGALRLAALLYGKATGHQPTPWHARTFSSTSAATPTAQQPPPPPPPTYPHQQRSSTSHHVRGLIHAPLFGEPPSHWYARTPHPPYLNYLSRPNGPMCLPQSLHLKHSRDCGSYCRRNLATC
jgi:hypothetical protein